MLHSEIVKMFTYREPVDDQVDWYRRIREDARLLANTINAMAPECDEKSFAITKLREAVMWANAAIALNE